MCVFVCFSYQSKVEHYQIQRDKRDWVSVDGEEYFENLVKLVEVRLGYFHCTCHCLPFTLISALSTRCRWLVL